MKKVFLSTMMMALALTVFAQEPAKEEQPKPATEECADPPRGPQPPLWEWPS